MNVIKFFDGNEEIEEKNLDTFLFEKAEKDYLEYIKDTKIENRDVNSWMSVSIDGQSADLKALDDVDLSNPHEIKISFEGSSENVDVDAEEEAEEAGFTWMEMDCDEYTVSNEEFAKCVISDDSNQVEVKISAEFKFNTYE